MGQVKSLICPTCDYQAMTSAGPDRGFVAYTNTFVCLKCKTIHDLVLIKGELKSNGQESKLTNQISENEKCKNCGENKFKLWDHIRKACPKCDSKMRSNKNGFIINWD